MSPLALGLTTMATVLTIGFLTIWATETIYQRLHPRNT